MAFAEELKSNVPERGRGRCVGQILEFCPGHWGSTLAQAKCQGLPITPHYSHIFSLASQTHVRASLGCIALCETTNRDGFLAGGHRKSPVINPHNLKPLRVLVVLNIFIYI